MTKPIKFKINKPYPLIKDNGWITAQDIINSHERGFKEGRKSILDIIKKLRKYRTTDQTIVEMNINGEIAIVRLPRKKLLINLEELKMEFSK